MSNDKSTGMGFLSFLTLLFIALKLTGYVTWTWIWVLSPLWLPITVILFLCLVAKLILVMIK